MRLDLEANNVFVCDMSVEAVRELVGTIDNDDLTSAMDEAQGHVHMDADKESYVVIKITK